jgi:hypothetical protein
MNNFDFSHKACNLDISNLCTLECPRCMRISWKNKKDIPGSIMTVDQFRKIVKYFRHIHFCGQVSDPIFNPNFITFLKMCRDAKKTSSVSTAASQRSISWYEDAFTTNPKTKWVFGLDGLPEESCLYRINQDGEKLFEVMKTGAKMGVRIEWQYIVFSYNEDHIDEANEMAKANNIEFVVNYSGRWNGKEDPYRPRNSEFSA